ncbi:MAG: flavodoxin reductase [Brumimicrobium sp.]|nr:flavodoxin reductase [Brumimicrobium sp.]
MSKHEIQIKSIEKVTHDVNRYRTEKPDGYEFTPGQATEVSIDEVGLKEKGRPFTFTSLPKDDHLEFTIKSYTDHNGVTKELLGLDKRDKFIIEDAFGAIKYDGEGTFIAGGAGVTPFIAIFRKLEKEGEIGDNQLLFANKTKKDIILREEFRNMLGSNFVNILSQERTNEYAYGHISKDFLKEHVKDFDKKFYVCGPPEMMESVLNQLKELGVKGEQIVTEDM